MTTKTEVRVGVVPTHRATIYVAGNLDDARRLISQHCWEVGLCVNLMPCEFIFTGGAETGVAVTLVNYPRFPSCSTVINLKAITLGRALLEGLHQRTALVVCDDDTVWLTREPPGTTERPFGHG